METVTPAIDGRQITVDKGKTVLQAALENGIPVPFYPFSTNFPGVIPLKDGQVARGRGPASHDDFQ